MNFLNQETAKQKLYSASAVDTYLDRHVYAWSVFTKPVMQALSVSRATYSGFSWLFFFWDVCAFLGKYVKNMGRANRHRLRSIFFAACSARGSRLKPTICICFIFFIALSAASVSASDTSRCFDTYQMVSGKTRFRHGPGDYGFGFGAWFASLSFSFDRAVASPTAFYLGCIYLAVMLPSALYLARRQTSR
jgi:hypothetical protein